MITYGYRVRETSFDGCESSTTVSGFDDLRTAQIETIRIAILSGWTYPRWWQWWRWSDTRPPKDVVAEAQRAADAAKEL